MLFLFIIICALIATGVVVKLMNTKDEVSTPVPTYQVEESIPAVETPKLVEEPIVTIEAIPTSPPSTPTMKAKPKRKPTKPKQPK